MENICDGDDEPNETPKIFTNGNIILLNTPKGEGWQDTSAARGKKPQALQKILRKKDCVHVSVTTGKHLKNCLYSVCIQMP